MQPRDLIKTLNAEVLEQARHWVPVERVRQIRSVLLKMTRGGKRARILAVAEAADCSQAVVEFCYEAGLLKGYTHEYGRQGGFTRKLQLIIDNTK